MAVSILILSYEACYAKPPNGACQEQGNAATIVNNNIIIITPKRFLPYSYRGVLRHSTRLSIKKTRRPFRDRLGLGEGGLAAVNCLIHLTDHRPIGK